MATSTMLHVPGSFSSDPWSPNYVDPERLSYFASTTQYYSFSDTQVPRDRMQEDRQMENPATTRSTPPQAEFNPGRESKTEKDEDDGAVKLTAENQEDDQDDGDDSLSVQEAKLEQHRARIAPLLDRQPVTVPGPLFHSSQTPYKVPRTTKLQTPRSPGYVDPWASDYAAHSSDDADTDPWAIDTTEPDAEPGQPPRPAKGKGKEKEDEDGGPLWTPTATELQIYALMGGPLAKTAGPLYERGFQVPESLREVGDYGGRSLEAHPYPPEPWASFQPPIGPEEEPLFHAPTPMRKLPSLSYRARKTLSQDLNDVAGFIKVNGKFVDPDSETAVYKAVKGERGDTPPIPGFIDPLPPRIMTEDEQDKFYCDYVYDCDASDDPFRDREGDPRSSRITPEDFAIWASGAVRKPKLATKKIEEWVEGLDLRPRGRTERQKETDQNQKERHQEFCLETNERLSPPPTETEPSVLHSPDPERLVLALRDPEGRTDSNSGGSTDAPGSSSGGRPTLRRTKKLKVPLSHFPPMFAYMAPLVYRAMIADSFYSGGVDRSIAIRDEPECIRDSAIIDAFGSGDLDLGQQVFASKWKTLETIGAERYALNAEQHVLQQQIDKLHAAQQELEYDVFRLALHKSQTEESEAEERARKRRRIVMLYEEAEERITQMLVHQRQTVEEQREQLGKMRVLTENLRLERERLRREVGERGGVISGHTEVPRFWRRDRPEADPMAFARREAGEGHDGGDGERFEDAAELADELHGLGVGLT